MTCDELMQLLDDYITGQLLYEQSVRVEMHLSCCPHCGTLVQTYQRTVLIVRELPRQRALPPALARRLWQAIQDEQDRNSSQQ